MWDQILKYLNTNKDALGWLFGSGVILAIFGGIYRFIVWQIKEYRIRRIRTNENFSFKIIPPNSNVAKEILGGLDDDPLADRNIPYQQRIQGRNTRRELEELIEDNRRLLITGRTGVGKTREAVQLAQSLNNEGWTVLYLTREAWLNAPAKLPSNVPERKLLFVLDDLNKKCYAGKAEINPNAEESLTVPINEPFQTRLQTTLDAFDTFCGKGEIRVISTARNEKISEFDEPSDWDKLEWTKYITFWENFKLVELSEPDEKSEQQLLAETSIKAGIYINSDEIENLAKRNDGTFRNLVENLSVAKTEGGKLSSESFRDTLKGTWQKRFQRVTEKYPEAIYIYDAIELIRDTNIDLRFSTALKITQIIAGWSAVERLKYKRKTNLILKELTETENILYPRDGQIEAKGYRINIEKYLPFLYKQIYFKRFSEYQNITIRNFYVLPAKIRNLILLSLIPKSIFVPSKKLTSFDKRICKALGLDLIDEIGLSYAEAGFPLFAEQIYLKALVLKTTNEDNSASWVNLGNSYMALERHEDAVKAFRKAYMLDYKRGGIYLGYAYRSLGLFEEAIHLYHEIIELDPQNSNWRNEIGNVYYDFGRYDDAVQAYTKAIELSPNGGVFLGNLGITYLAQGKIDMAIEAFRKSQEVDPKYKYSILSLALCNKIINNNIDAERLINSVAPTIKEEDEYVQACFYISKGSIDEGLVCLKKGLKKGQTSKVWAQKDPNFEIVRDVEDFKKLVKFN